MTPTADPQVQVTLLGTGTSTGVPVLHCTCAVCQSPDPKDTRTRCSCWVRAGNLNLLIDVSPDFRQQAFREKVPPRLDALLLTHNHADHVMGMDDLRPFCFGQKRPLPCYAAPATAEVVRDMFAYIFKDGTYPGVPQIQLHPITESFTVESRYETGETLSIEPIEVYHGALPILGYRIGRFAYLTDVSRIPEAQFARLENLDLLILSALRDRSHPSHFTIEEAVAAAQRIGAKQTVFIHMSHEVMYAPVNATLPTGICLGYDGLTCTARL